MNVNFKAVTKPQAVIAVATYSVSVSVNEMQFKLLQNRKR